MGREAWVRLGIVLLAGALGPGCAAVTDGGGRGSPEVPARPDRRDTPAAGAASGNPDARPGDARDAMSIEPVTPFSPELLVGRPWPQAQGLARSNGWWAVAVHHDDGPNPAIAYGGRRIEVSLRNGVVSGVRTYSE